MAQDCHHRGSRGPACLRIVTQRVHDISAAFYTILAMMYSVELHRTPSGRAMKTYRKTNMLLNYHSNLVGRFRHVFGSQSGVRIRDPYFKNLNLPQQLRSFCKLFIQKEYRWTRVTVDINQGKKISRCCLLHRRPTWWINQWCCSSNRQLEISLVINHQYSK